MRPVPVFTVSHTLVLLLVTISQGTLVWARLLGAVYYVGGVPRTLRSPWSSPTGGHRPLPWEPSSREPMFDPSPPQNVTALKDDIAYLHCIVHNRGNRTVSWIRASDLHILTVAQYTYTADDRFEVIHSPESNAQSWVLKIKSVQPRDSGRYECQINTHPTDPITFPVDLAVFVPSARILGSPERYVDRGSTINLTCIINFNPESPTEIFWYHNNKVINYDNPDSRVSVITDRGEATKTTLLIHDANDAATGTYACVPSASTTASVRIQILNGETPAAMQTSAASPVCRPLRWQYFGDHSLLFLLLLLLLVFGVSSTNQGVCLLSQGPVSSPDHPAGLRSYRILAVDLAPCLLDDSRDRRHGRWHGTHYVVYRAGDASGVRQDAHKHTTGVQDPTSQPCCRSQEHRADSTCVLLFQDPDNKAVGPDFHTGRPARRVLLTRVQQTATDLLQIQQRAQLAL